MEKTIKSRSVVLFFDEVRDNDVGNYTTTENNDCVQPVNPEHDEERETGTGES